MRRTALACLAVWIVTIVVSFAAAQGNPLAPDRHRSPVDLVLSPDGQWLATANQTSNSVSLVRRGDGALLDEEAVGERPAAIAMFPDGRRLLVSCQYGGELAVLAVADESLSLVKRIPIGFEPLGVALSPDGRMAYVAQSAADCVAVVDVERGVIEKSITVGRQPRYLALSPGGDRLAVGVAGERGMAIVDTASGTLLHVDRFVGLNLGHVTIAPADGNAYFPWMVYRRNPINPTNIRLGWVLASRLARLSLEGGSRREAISLDPPGRAVADPHGVAVSDDGGLVVLSSAGTHELLVYDNDRLPYKERGSTDHIEAELLKDETRFWRIEVGGRPLGLRLASDNQTAFVANYLRDAVQEVDLNKRAILREIPLNAPIEPSPARRGEAIFYDAQRSLDQWYSCHSCHQEGAGNAVAMDTNNDGGRFTFKTVLPLFQVDRTAPWTWHGWQNSLGDAVATSITSTMEGQPPGDDDVQAVVEYLKTIRLPANPNRGPEGELTPAAERGRAVFESAAAGCITCHKGPQFTDGQIHEVGLEAPGDGYRGFNTPSLLGTYRKLEWLHDGRAKSLEALLADPHSPEKVAGERPLEAAELADLVAYLKSL